MRKSVENKSVLFVINTMGRAGAERALLNMIDNLKKENIDIYLYVMIPRGELFSEVPDYVKILNKKTDSGSVLSFGGSLFVGKCLLKASVKKGVVSKAVNRFKALKGMEKGEEKKQKKEKILRRILADGAEPLKMTFDLAVAYIEGPAAWFTAEKIKAHKKAAFVHVDYGRAGYDKKIDMECYESFDKIFMVSEDVKNSFLKVYPQLEGKSQLFFNIIDRDKIKRKAEEGTGFEDCFDGPRILTVGRLHYQKGYDIGIDTAAILNEKGINFKWYVLGEGSERKNIEKLISEKKLEDKFILLGAKSNPYPYFSKADLYVCTSRFEGKSIVIEEAQALGKPIVAANCTGINEQIRDGIDGIVTEPVPHKLAEAICMLLNNPYLMKKYSEASLSKCLENKEGMNVFLELIQEKV